ncbi:hypothetical protein SteCoe_4039 [Stentor coeruleus]|uniref:Ral GTPase-activating protein subunit alpha/beta N-terminal domain-containing protein n=1 Tax=Stentor coeruleus TaxID=5963 RepID=A0A1R2CVT8_9CILI|nr:hypothetical protein SteCoe_4039 [Stentor coeruleus]
MHIGNFIVEDFKEKQNLDFASSHLDTNVLNFICSDEGSKYEVVKSVVLSVKKIDPENFLTDFHVKWAMECIGYAYSLPLEMSSTIMNAITIYNTWLTNPSKRPGCINTNEAYYQREMLGHMSLIFLDRSADPIYAELCTQVLKIFRSIVRKNLLVKENTCFLLKLCLLSFGPILSVNSDLSKKISGEMSRSLYEMFLRIEEREEILWKELCKNFSKWIINNDVMISWDSVAVSLTEKIINYLYGEGTDNMIINFKDEGDVAIVITFEHCILAWNYLVLNVLESTCKMLFEPIIHKNLVKAVSKIVGVFINVSSLRIRNRKVAIPVERIDSSEPVLNLSRICKDFHINYIEGRCSLPIPAIKDIIDIFGEWLFTQTERQGAFIHGQAEAISSLCKIFYKTSGTVPNQYLGKFYKVLFKSFKQASESNFQVAERILKYSVRLLTQDHRGIRVLLHRSCIFKVIGPYIMSREIPQRTKNYCYQILASIIPILKPYTKQGILTTVNESLIFAVTAENEANNIVLLFWTVCSYISIVEEQDILENLVKCIVNKVLLMEYTDKKLYLDCLNVISMVPLMFVCPSMISDGIAKDVVNKFIPNILRKTSKNLTDTLYISVLNMLMHWAFKFPTVLMDSNVKIQIFEALAGLKNFDRMKEYVNFIELTLLNNFGKNFPEYRFCGCDATIITNSFISTTFQNNIKHFLYKNKAVISIYNADESALIVIRNQIGRYVWKFKPTYGPSSIKSQPPLNLRITPHNKITKDPNLSPNNQKPDLSSSELKVFKKLSHLYIKSESSIKSFKPTITKLKPQIQPTSLNQESQIRSLLCHLGFFNQDQLQDLSLLHNSEIQQTLQELDSINNKEFFIIPIFYLDQPESEEPEIIKKFPSYPQSYLELLKQMGLFLNSSNNSQELFRSAFNLIEKYNGVILLREYYYEIVTISPSLCDTLRPFYIDEFLQYSQLVVIWNQRNPQPNSLKNPIIIDSYRFKKKTVILLTPLRNNIIRVNLIGTETNCGPLLDNMLVPLYLIGKFITRTIASFYSNATSRLALSQRRIEILNFLKDLSRKSESLSINKLSSVVSHTFSKSIK